MTPITPKTRKQINEDPFYKTCALYDQRGHICDGRLTMEHVIIYAGKQLQEKWAIIPLCASGHAVDQYQDNGCLNKELNLWVALNRATDEELSAISKAVPYTREKARLNQIYGKYEQRIPTNPTLYSKPVFKDYKFESIWYPINKKNQDKLEKIMQFYEDIGHSQTIFETIDTMIEKELKLLEYYKIQNNIKANKK